MVTGQAIGRYTYPNLAGIAHAMRLDPEFGILVEADAHAILVRHGVLPPDPQADAAEPAQAADAPAGAPPGPV